MSFRGIAAEVVETVTKAEGAGKGKGCFKGGQCLHLSASQRMYPLYSTLRSELLKKLGRSRPEEPMGGPFTLLARIDGDAPDPAVLLRTRILRAVPVR
jgi:hypothetical protein